ncbi:conserved exported hypothetical protein [Vibrio nigripulchritudo SO65]|uniref:hypothetical protein n=1 Tax=Vibrio nigripulchritudo TaxID=28173 RepID=UPI0003B1B88B|nr:hypothetical protein [Vibrio nigripulchritudo]CCN35978.1 conserved exported hypothetical protein [Vibrio nigripulchritudo AM115]CCN44204.1 conserved exported hypothetical protein [Vibrio nigripulchritudo FTn2]CCN64587.1 conserved exported hypothetical protein [Vibrio nigripulchritudo POn4]CCN75072.1 conserved exported hypothetical protein [Vibrio nigripulchritudo SO65]BCL69450.1 hypothetical protein VNTUMSATTG_13870 [Vibrio nigripulchritudo]
MKKITLFILAAMFSQPSFARTDCPIDTISHIQIEGSVVLYYQSSVWRRLGVLTDIGTKERYSALLSAQMSGKKVMVAYPRNDYNCHTTNYGESAFIVRTYN